MVKKETLKYKNNTSAGEKRPEGRRASFYIVEKLICDKTHTIFKNLYTSAPLLHFNSSVIVLSSYHKRIRMTNRSVRYCIPEKPLLETHQLNASSIESH